MLESYNAAREMEYEKLSAEEQTKRGILGRLVGIIADFKNPTRNERFYSEKLWENFFSNPLTQEKIKEKVFVGEFGHPADRTDIDPEKIAICLAEMPKKGTDGKIHGVFDILDTPCGRILKTLCDYGSHIGVSSRGTGDTFSDMDGRESVDAETFECECWDAVLVPAVKDARLKYVTESYNKKSLKQALKESLDNASDKDRQVMSETLKDLDIDIDSPEKDVDIDKKDADSTSEQSVAAVDDGAIALEELQEALGENSKLKERIISLQEQLSVCYAKESKLLEQNSRYKNATITLSGCKKKVNDLQDQLAKVTESLKGRDSQIKVLQQSEARLTESLQHAEEANSALQQQLSTYKSRTQALQESVQKNVERSIQSSEKLEAENRSLRESLEDMKSNSTIKQKEYSSKINSLKESQQQELADKQKLVEHYKKVANTAVMKYIDMRATHLNIPGSEIKSRLPKNYSFDDVDRLCESLKQRVVSMGKLPFDLAERRARLTESTGPVERVAKNLSIDDEVDESLTKFIN